MSDKEGPNFEEALKRLESIVERMEQGDLPLDESLALFQEGIALSRICTSQLNAADERVRKLVRVENGRFVIEPLDQDSPPEQETPAGRETPAEQEDDLKF